MSAGGTHGRDRKTRAICDHDGRRMRRRRVNGGEYTRVGSGVVSGSRVGDPGWSDRCRGHGATSAQNGKAERVLRTLNDIVRTLLLHSSMPSAYWAEALATATYLLNRRPSSAISHEIPFSRLYGQPPDLSNLRVFGCLCYPNLSANIPHKLAPRSSACVFLGYPTSHIGYRCLDLPSRRGRHHISPCCVR